MVARNINSQQAPAHAITQEVPIATFPGEAASITVVPVFPEGDPRNTNNPKGLPGDYRAGIVLGRPGRFELPEKVYHFSDQLSGDSHIGITRPAVVPGRTPEPVAIRLRAQTHAGSFLFDGRPNAKGFLGKLASEPFHAQNFDDALKRAYHAVAPSLSTWSAHLDVPVYVAQVDVTEMRTGAASAQVFTPPLEVSFAVEGEPKVGPEFLYYAGLYREALNSNSSAYRFLCLYKVIEGLRVLRKRLASVAGASGGQPQRFEFEQVPAEDSVLVPWLNAIYERRQWPQQALDQALPSDIRGKRFGQIIDSKLTPLRNEVAHAILDTGELGMSVDDMLKVDRVNLLLPLTRTIARRMLKNNFRQQFLSHLPEP